MSSRRPFQEILGYVIGGSIFLVLLPYGLFRASLHLDYLIPAQLTPFPAVRLIISILLCVVGLLFGFWSNRILNVKGKGGPVQIADLEISPKTQNLVVAGPYRYTRNPMLFGTCMFYYAVAIHLNSVIAFLLVTLFMIFMLLFVKLSEEPRLRKDFGSQYEEYCRKTSMFIPWPRK